MEHPQTVPLDNTQITAVVQSLSSNEENIQFKDIPCKTNGDHMDEDLHSNLSSSSKIELLQNVNKHYPMAEHDNVTNSKKAKYEEHERISLKRKLSDSDDEATPYEKHIRVDESNTIGMYKSGSPKVINSSDNELIGGNEESQLSNQPETENCDLATSSSVSDIEDNMPPLSNSRECIDDRQLLPSSQESVSRCSQDVSSDNQDESISQTEFYAKQIEKAIETEQNLHSLNVVDKLISEAENVENTSEISKLPLVPNNRSPNISRLPFEYETYDEYDEPVRFRSNYNDNENNGDNIEPFPQRLSQIECDETELSDADEENLKETKGESYCPENHSISQRLTKEYNEEDSRKEDLSTDKKIVFEEKEQGMGMLIDDKDIGIKLSESKKVPVSLVNYECGDFSTSEESNKSEEVPVTIKRNESETESDSDNEQISSVRSKSGSKTISDSSSESSSRSSSRTRSRSSASRSISTSRSPCRRSTSRNSNLDNVVEKLTSNQSNDKIELQTECSLNNNSEDEEDSGLLNDINEEEIKKDTDKFTEDSYSGLLNDSNSYIDAGNQFQDTESTLSAILDSENSNSRTSNRVEMHETTTNSDKCDEILPAIASCSKDEFLRILEKSIDKNCDSSANSNDSDLSIVNKEKKLIINQNKSEQEDAESSINDANSETNMDLGIDLSTNKMNTNQTTANSKDSSYDDDEIGPIDFSEVKNSIEQAFPVRNVNFLGSYQGSQNHLEQNQTNNLMLFNMQSTEIDKLAFPASNNEIDSKADALNLTISPTMIDNSFNSFRNSDENDPPDIYQNSSNQNEKTEKPTADNSIISSLDHLIPNNSDTIPICQQNKTLSQAESCPVNVNGNGNNTLLHNKQELINVNQPNQSFENNTTQKNVYQCYKCVSTTFNTFYELQIHQNACQVKKASNYQQSTITTAKQNKVNKPISLLQKKLEEPLVASNSSQFYSQELHKVPKSNLPANNIQLSTVSESNNKKKKVFFCSACKTFYNGWNLFFHMREVHKRLVCLYCVRTFPTGEKLTLHLELKHDLEQNHFISHEKLLKSSLDTTFVMCCNCEFVFSEQEPFVDHLCHEIIKPCSLCGIRGGHSSNCKGISREEKKVKKSLKLKEKVKKIPLPNENTVNKVNNENIMLKVPEVLPQLQETINIMQQQQPLKINGWPSTNSVNNLNTKQQDIPNNFTNQFMQSELVKNVSNSQPPPSPPPTVSSDLIFPYEESNSSDQMIIDETCNNNNTTYNNTDNSLLSPFKNVNKTESNYIQHSNRPNQRPLPVGGYGQGKKISASDGPDLDDIETDENQSTSVSENNHDSETIPSTEEQLIVPKFKLRIPKQYQKAIDSDASSVVTSESEQDYVDNDNDNDNDCEQEMVPEIHDQQPIEHISNNMPQDNNANLTVPAEELNNARNNCLDVMEKQQALDNNFSTNYENNRETDLKLNTSFERSLNDFERIQREIEKTKMDIERTKISFQQQPAVIDANELSSDVSMNTDHLMTEQNNSSLNSNENITTGVEPEQIHKIDEESYNNSQSISQPSELATISQPLVNGANYQSMENTIPPSLEQKIEDSIAKPIIEEEESDGIVLASIEVRPVDLFLDRPLDKISPVEFLRICVKTVFPLCLYCNHARRIAVNGNSLALHLLAEHRFSATVDSITAEELLPSTIVTRLKSFLPELENTCFNSESYCKIDGMDPTSIVEERIFECYSCRFQTRVHKDLYLHNRKMHMKSAILCIMCRSNFFSYSEILCHKCPGIANKISVYDIKFRCCLCEVDNIPSAFRLMIHLRKKHNACDVCLEDCLDQNRLASHVWKHKLHHVCFRCGIGYRNKPDITKHLFWKHGTESIICKRCLQKRWRHIYHFCTPAPSFVCDTCNLCFSKANILKVHKRLHSNDVPHMCIEDNCEQKFISKKLLHKHAEEHKIELEKLGKIEECLINGSNQSLEENKLTTEVNNGDINSDNLKDEKIEKKLEEPGSGNAKLENDEKNPPTDGVKETNTDDLVLNKKRKKANKKIIKERIDDLNLQAPNLSESDSSDESEIEKDNLDDSINLNKTVGLSPQSNDERMDDQVVLDESTKIVDIWANFKSYQASQNQTDNENKDMNENSNDYFEPNILHVSQSDHDYCSMFKIIVEKTTIETIYTEDKNLDLSGSSNDSPKIKDSDTEVLNKKRCSSKSPRKKQKSPRKKMRSGSESSSSESSSSSCSCGSNCSCSSSDSNNSSSSSSSDDDSDSSNSVSGRKQIKESSDVETTLKNEAEDESTAAVETTKSETNNIENAEVNYLKIKKPKELIIYESDLETSETDTDEDFYDDHPQKKANEQLDEKRRQLMARASLSPHQNHDILVNSRPTTPALPDETIKEKKIKTKKKKHERKITKPILPTAKLNENPEVITSYNPLTHQTDIFSPEVDYLPPFNLIASPGAAETVQQQITPLSHPMAHLPIHNIHPISKLAAAPIPQQNRISTGSSCSDADASLKRSKRARRPNKFYGYTSDEESMLPTRILGGQLGNFKPTPPPPLTWCKEDLPTPSKRTIKSRAPKEPKIPKKMKSTTMGSGIGGKKSLLNRERFLLGKKRMKTIKKLPGIPTLKIRPLAAPSIIPNALSSEFITQATNLQQFAQTTSFIDTMQLPPTSINHIEQPLKYPSQEETSGSESSDDNDDDFSHLSIPMQEFANEKQSLFLLPPKKIWASQEQQLTPVVQAPPPPPPPIKIPPALLENPDYNAIQYFKRNNIRYPIRAPAGARPPREGESVYCYCRCPYDEVSEMIACDGSNCMIEWFHFECVGIMLAPQGKWYCAECRPQNSNIYSD